MMNIDIGDLDRVDAWIREHAVNPNVWVLGEQRLTFGQALDLVALIDIVRPGWRGGVLAGHERKEGNDRE